ncbi:MAG TPA: hypothetical protein P5293_01070 [Bacteroidales bacterium]|nr:hypothetical protein [Bacteroidales bacterium]
MNSPKQPISRKQFRKAVMPVTGTQIGSYKIDYVNYAQLRFTAKASKIPDLGEIIEWMGRKYIVNHIIKDDRFSAQFCGFVENPVVGEGDKQLTDLPDVGDDLTAAGPHITDDTVEATMFPEKVSE